MSVRTSLLWLVVTITVFCLQPIPAWAQVTPPLLNKTSVADTVITGSCVIGAVVSGTFTHEGATVGLPSVMCPSGTFSIDVSALRLRKGDTLTLQQSMGGTSSAPLATMLDRDGPVYDERGVFEASGFIGEAVDTFGSEELKRYLNPETNGTLTTHNVFGFDFAYRLLSLGESRFLRPQIWLYGETVHGVRSEDIKCTDENGEKIATLPSCQAELAEFTTDLPKNALYMLRNADSLEAYAGVRVELFQMNVPGSHPAAFYINLQPGFLEVAGSDGDMKANHQVTVGARVIGGPFVDSFLEVGRGRNELFATDRGGRWRFDGYLQRDVALGTSIFFQMYADVDPSPGADSIQSYFGVNFNFETLFTALKKKP